MNRAIVFNLLLDCCKILSTLVFYQTNHWKSCLQPLTREPVSYSSSVSLREGITYSDQMWCTTVGIANWMVVFPYCKAIDRFVHVVLQVQFGQQNPYSALYLIVLNWIPKICVLVVLCIIPGMQLMVVVNWIATWCLVVLMHLLICSSWRKMELLLINRDVPVGIKPTGCQRRVTVGHSSKMETTTITKKMIVMASVLV